ncbi:hypothetical protein ACYF6T_22410 [Streptomyces sp. 7R007]
MTTPDARHDHAVTALAARLSSGEGLADIRRTLLPAGWTSLLEAAAVARFFDQKTYDHVLSDFVDQPAPPLGELLDAGAVERAPGRKMLQVPDAHRQAYLLSWLGDRGRGQLPPRLLELERRLSDHWHTRGKPAERLRHLMLADPDTAARLFNDLFHRSDSERDFTRCQDLTQVLADRDRSAVVDPALLKLAEDRAGYLRARTYWVADYAHSAQFLEPDGLWERARHLLSGDGPRVWQMYGIAGSGKTMQLRWLISRKAVTAELDVNCARVDFDHIDPLNAARWPWLLILEIADQLEQRLPARVFTALDEYAAYRSLLRRPTSHAAAEASRGIRTQDEHRIEREVVQAFTSRFAETFDEHLPVLVVVDTLEEVVLRSPSRVDSLLRLLGKVVTGCPAIRLVLSGRFDLSDQHSRALATLGRYENVPVAPFTDAEADDYLCRIRGIQSAEQRRFIVQRSDGLPFYLAFFADDVDRNPDATTDTLSREAGPAVRRRYVGSKVVGRVDDPLVRWLLYYGVIPRRLHRCHVLDVVQPRLREKMEQAARADGERPADDLFPAVPPPGREQLEDAWRKLTEYSGTSLRITEVPGDDEAVVFHSAVLGPMRDLIADTPDFALLHGDFVRYFEQRAEEEPAQWSRYLREALYHRFQTRDPQAPEVWRAAMERAWREGETDRLRDLAEELLGSEYVDRDPPPLGMAGGTVVPPSLKAEAHLNLAFAHFHGGMAEGVSLEAHDHKWSDATRQLKQADFLYALAGERTRAHSAREDMVRAALQSVAGNAEEAVELIDHRVLSHDRLPDLERLWALKIRAASLARLRSLDAADAFHEVERFATGIGRLDVAADAAAGRAAQRRLMGDVGGAVDLYARAADLCTRAGGSPFGAVAQQAGLLLRCRRARQALAVLAQVPVADAAQEADRARLQAKAHLLLGQEIPALAAIQCADAAAEGLRGADRYRHLALNAQLHGVALGELQAISNADDHFTNATGLWKELGYYNGEPECHYLYARFLLRDSMDLPAAHRLLEPKEAPGQEPEFALRLVLLAREWAARSQGVVSEAGMPVPYEKLPALVRPLHALCHLAGLPDDQPSAGILRQLTEALAEVRPAEARLATLRDLVDNPALEHQVPWSLLEPFYALDGDESDPDRALAGLLVAQVRGEEDPRRLERIARTLIGPRAEHRLAVWRCARIAARLGHPDLAARLLDEVAWERPPEAAQGPGVRVPHVRLALSALVLRAGVEPRHEAAEHALRRAMELAEERDVVRESLPAMLALCARRAQVDGVPERVAGLLAGMSRPAVLDNDVQGDLRLFREWPEERGLELRGRPDIDPVNDVALSVPSKLSDWHQDEWPQRVALSKRVLQRLRFVRLWSEDPDAHALPWELTLQPALQAVTEQPMMYRTMPTAALRVDVCWLQLGLNRRLGLTLDVDGVVGPHTRAALERVQPGAGDGTWPRLTDATVRELLEGAPRHARPHRVLVVSAKQDERSVPLSYWLRDQRPLPARLPVNVTVVEPETGVVPQVAYPAADIDVLHLAAPLRQRDGMPYLELSPAGHARRLASKARGSDLFPVQLARWLGGFEPGRTPLVVLDPPCPGSEADIGVQLLLRNLFAAQLFSHGRCPAIVCTGLFPGGGLDHAIGFYQALSERRPLAEAVRQLRTAPVGSPPRGTHFASDDDARRAIALFAADSALLDRYAEPA